MSPLEGGRHYTGGGLGEHNLAWRCPACGAENTGPLGEPCATCGSGKPGYRPTVADPPPVAPRLPRVSERAPDDPTYAAVQGDVASRWADQHPDATVADAYRAGCADTLAALRHADEQRRRAADTYQDRLQRTLTAALTYFRDHVLSDLPDEEAAEWLTFEEVNRVLTELGQGARSEEPAHV